MKNSKCLIFFLSFLFLIPQLCWGNAPLPPSPGPYLNISIDGKDIEGISAIVKIFILLTLLSLLPTLLIMLTSFTRIIIVLSILRQAIGTHQMPPNQVIIGITLFLTFFIMSPVGKEISEKALKPYIKGKIGEQQAIKNACQPIRKFMFKQTREKDLALFVKASGLERPKNTEDVPTLVLVPAFIISELKTAFEIGFLLYVPFMIIDLVVSSILLSMGMLMLPPVMISLPLKLILFVLVDGWHLIVGSLIESFS